MERIQRFCAIFESGDHTPDEWGWTPALREFMDNMTGTTIRWATIDTVLCTVIGLFEEYFEETGDDSVMQNERRIEQETVEKITQKFGLFGDETYRTIDPEISRIWTNCVERKLRYMCEQVCDTPGR